MRRNFESFDTESPPPGLRHTGGGAFGRVARSVIAGAMAVAVTALRLAPAISGEAITTNQPADSLSFVDLTTMKTAGEVKLSGKPAGIALSPDKTLAYVTAPEGKELFAIDIAKREVVQRLALGGGPLGIAAHPVKPEIYVADWYAHKISVVAWRTRDVVEGDVHMGGAPDDSAVTARKQDLLFEVGEIPVGQSPSGLAVTPDGKLLLSADRDSNQVSVIDIESRKVVGTIATGERPFGMTIDAEGKRAYTANVASNDVTVIDIAARKAIGTVKVGNRPYAVALTSGKGFVTDQYVGTVTVFDTAVLQPLKTIEACDHPEGIEADATGSAVYVACWGDNQLLKIDPATLEITGKADVGDGPRAFGKFLR